MITIEQFCTFFKPLDPDPDSGSNRPWIRIRNTAVIFHLSGQTACALHSPQFPSLPTVAHMLSPLAGIRCTKLAICTLSSLHAFAMNTSSPGEPCSLEKNTTPRLYEIGSILAGRWVTTFPQNLKIRGLRRLHNTIFFLVYFEQWGILGCI